jgi:undecaprenyl-diphosphatase
MVEILESLRGIPIELKALIMGMIEGLTEFLPISSTGHLILVGSLLAFDDERAKAFDIAIQTGAVSSILWLYRQRFREAVGPAFRRDVWKAWLSGHGNGLPAEGRFFALLFVAFLPSALLGLAFAGFIKTHLFSPITVAIALIVGGVVILWAEHWQSRSPHRIRLHSVDDARWQDALKIGCAQALALFPGTSRSGATIIGGMFFGFSRKAATEFSFFLAVPTLIAAGGYALFRQWGHLQLSDLPLFAIGTAMAFFTALAVVRWLVGFVSRHSLNGFAYYRIAFGLLILVTWQFGWIDWRT